jgi:hypothetical protein
MAKNEYAALSVMHTLMKTFTHFIPLVPNGMHEGCGRTKATIKKKDGYSRVPLDAIVMAFFVARLNRVAVLSCRRHQRVL